MKLRRLGRMGMAEIGCRGRQEVSKWWDRMATSGGAVGEAEDAGAARLLETFREEAPGRFFEGVTSARTPALLAKRMPATPADVVSTAEAACMGRFDLLGYRGLSFGRPVDWHLDPVSGRRAPLVHWSRLDPLDPRGADSKVVWELNRHQWLVTLGQAYRSTGDERYAEAFAEYVHAWMRANPRGMGLNWASSLEVALRLISWCWALVLFRTSATLTPELFARMRGGIRDHASHVESYLSHYFAPNTHLTGEALGLFYAAVLFPDLPRAQRWRAVGTRILVEQSERQVWEDGVYFEQSTCYQRYTVEIHLHFLALSARNGLPVPGITSDRVQSMLDFLLAVLRPDGTVPEIGDADGGWLLPLTRRSPLDVRGVFSTAAALFGRPDYAWAAGGPAPETLWLLGPTGLTAFDALRPAPPARLPSRLFTDGGYAVMRDGWAGDSHHLILDAGPLSSPSSGHGHADLLSLQCCVFGEPCIVDPGTFGYAAHPEWRDFFRGTAAHSTVVVDGADQAVPAGAFGWRARPRARLRRWISTDATDFADADHDAYLGLADPVRHRRRILFVKPRYWVVVDDLEGAGQHRLELRFQFAPIEVTLDGALWARARGRAGRGLRVRPFATVALKGEIRQGEGGPIQGWVSPDYGQREPAPMLLYSTVARLPLRIFTLLLPSADPWAPPPAVSPLVREGLGLVGLEFGEGGETVSIEGQEGLVVSSTRPRTGPGPDASLLMEAL